MNVLPALVTDTLPGLTMTTGEVEAEVEAVTTGEGRVGNGWVGWAGKSAVARASTEYMAVAERITSMDIAKNNLRFSNGMFVLDLDFFLGAGTVAPNMEYFLLRSSREIC